jgi:membrane protease YdiL (CAAX protease family)
MVSAADTGSATARDPVVGWTTLLTGLAITAFLYWRNHDTSAPMGFDEYNLLNTAIVLWIPLLVLLLVLRQEPADFGFTVGDAGKGWLYVAIAFLLFVPVILLFAPSPGAQEYYISWLGSSRAILSPLWNGSGYIGGQLDWGRLAYHEVVMGFYMFGWEFFFRGFLLNGLRKISPLWIAILIQAVLFTALHWSKPLSEVASSFPGAIIMALIAIRCRSFVPCFLLHFLVSAGFDGAVLYSHFHH